MNNMEKIGSKLDKVIKSVNHEVFGVADSSSVEVKTSVVFKNGYITSEITRVMTDKFANYDFAKEHCIQINIISLRKGLNEVKDYFDFLNNKGLTLINNKEFDEYVRLTKKNKLEFYSLLNENFEVIDKVKTLDFKNKDVKYVIVPINELKSLYKDRDSLTAVYKACIDNWLGGCDEAKR